MIHRSRLSAGRVWEKGWGQRAAGVGLALLAAGSLTACEPTVEIVVEGGDDMSYAPPPDYFITDRPLLDVAQQAADEGRWLVAVASADWCGPCQWYKRYVLSTPEVEAWFRDNNALAVMVDTDAAPDDAQMLGANALPFTAVVSNGDISATKVGGYPSDELLAWLNRQTR